MLDAYLEISNIFKFHRCFCCDFYAMFYDYLQEKNNLPSNVLVVVDTVSRGKMDETRCIN